MVFHVKLQGWWSGHFYVSISDINVTQTTTIEDERLKSCLEYQKYLDTYEGWSAGAKNKNNFLGKWSFVTMFSCSSLIDDWISLKSADSNEMCRFKFWNLRISYEIRNQMHISFKPVIK